MKKQFTTKARYLGLKITVIFFVLLLSAGQSGWGQTNPAAFDLSSGNFLFSGFVSGATTTYPTSMQGWRFSTEPTSSTVGSASGDQALLASSAIPTQGNIKNEISNGLSLLNSSSNNIGAIVVALNTTGRKDITLGWKAQDYTSTEGRINAIKLQYRIGTTGDFTDVAGTTYTSSGTSQAAEQTFSNIILPAGVNNQAVVQVRWLYYYVSGTGARDRIRLDDISITSSIGGNTVPTITTQAVSSIGSTSATGNGNITATGGVDPTVRGFCWDLATNPDPDINDSKVEETGTFSTGPFSGNIVSLTAGTQYKVRAYATNTEGTSYGSSVMFYTLSGEPSNHVTSFTGTAASQIQIDLTFDAANTITNAAGYLIIQKTGSAPTGLPTDANSYTVGSTIGDGTVAAIITNTSATSTSITGLSAGTHYYYTIFPFNWDGSNAATYNYKTDGTVPNTDASTQAPLDATSEVSGPAIGLQPNPGSISSLVNTELAAVRVFDMNIYDYATSDAQPTKITQVTIKPGINNTANWVNTIQGVKLSIDGGSSFVTTGTPTISASSIVIPITLGNLNISNNNTIVLSLYVYLKSSGLTDNSILEFKVDATAGSHGFAADATGSTFMGTFASAPVSNQIQIDVEASKLLFVQQPSNVNTSANITPAVTVSAEDINGNRDLDYTANVTITATGASLNNSPVSVAAVSGLATFSTLSFSSEATGVTLNASSGFLTGATSNSFDIIILPAPGEIVINQFSPDYSGANNEYIELVNRTDKTFDLSNLKIEYQSASGTSGSAGGNLTGILGPYQYWLLSPDATITVGQTSALTRDGSITAGFAGGSGQIALRLKDSPNTIIDGLAYGSITSNNLGEGSAASTPPTDGGLKRTYDGIDSDANNNDFSTVSNANIYLRNHNSVCIPVNYALATSYPADVVISGSSPLITLSGNTTITGKLTILSGSLTIANNQNMTVNGTLTNNAGTTGLVIKSDNNGTGSLIHSNSGVNATVERYIPGWTSNGGWHQISSPVTNQPVAPDFAASGDTTCDFFSWDEQINMWIDVKPNANTTNFGVGIGYLVAYSPSTTLDHTFHGILNEGNITSALTYHPSGPGNRGWNLIGNPYPCGLQANIDAWTKTNVNNYLYVWDDQNANYIAWNAAANEVIPAMQAFWVRANNVNPSLTVPATDRTHSTINILKSSPNNLLKLNVVSPNNYKDQIMIQFRTDATNGYDQLFDAPKLESTVATAPQFYAYAGQEKLSIDVMGDLNGNVSIPLGFEPKIDGSFTLNASELSSFSSSVEISLEDIKTGTITNLKQNPTIPFTANISDAVTRFVLHFIVNSTGISEDNVPEVNVFTQNGQLIVNSNDKVKEVVVYNLAGQVINKLIPSNNNFLVSLPSTQSVYLVKVITSKTTVTKKVIN